MPYLQPFIRACCGRKEAVARLRRWAEESVIESDRNRFVAAAEETLTGIHEGNFARYRIRPSEFMSWKAAWASAGNTKFAQPAFHACGGEFRKDR